MGKLNQIAGDILNRINPEAAQQLIIARHIKRELGNKKLILCGSGDTAVKLDKKLVSMGCAGAAYYIDTENTGVKVNGREVRAVESIMYENTDDIYIALIASNRMHRILGSLLELGFTPEMLHVFCNANIPGGSRLLDVYDVNLGFTRVDDIPGFTIFDSGVDDTRPKKVIVTLGGSTTDATFANVMSWSEIMQHKLTDRGINAVVYCGGIAAANSTQELIKCIRDVIPMKPDAVISYSGINDIKMLKSSTPFVLDYQKDIADRSVQAGIVVNNKAYRNTGSDSKLTLKAVTAGLDNNKPYSQYWVDNIRMMHAVCTEFGIPFHAFLQPNAYVSRGGEISFHRELMEDSQAQHYRELTEDMKKLVENIDYITDITDALDGNMKWYMDDCHLLEPGNRIIADRILPVTIELVK